MIDFCGNIHHSSEVLKTADLSGFKQVQDIRKKYKTALKPKLEPRFFMSFMMKTHGSADIN